MMIYIVLASIATLLANKAESVSNDVYNLTITLPLTHGKVSESTLCSSVKMPEDRTVYIRSIQPKGNRLDNYRHIAVFGCKNPSVRSDQQLDFSQTGQVVPTGPYWNCDKDPAPEYLRTYPCIFYTEHRIYANDRPEKALVFPPETGYPVGKEAGLDFLIVATHLVSSPLPGDDTRIEISFDSDVERNVGLLDIQMPTIQLQPKSRGFSDCVIRVTDDVYRQVIGSHAHTHGLGEMSSLYKVANGKWSLIYKGKVRTGVTMNKAKDELDIHKGDAIALRCVTNNPYNYVLTRNTDPKESCLNLLWMTYEKEVSPLNIHQVTYRRCLQGEEKAAALNYTEFPEESSFL